MRHLISFSCYVFLISAQAHEDTPYEDVDDVCKICSCITSTFNDKSTYHMLDCSMKNFTHILANWPPKIDAGQNGTEVIAIFSKNNISLLQQLPATNAALTFSCRHCGIREIQIPTFIDVHNIKRLDLSWNELKSSVLSSNIFRGAFQSDHYKEIALQELDLSHNSITALEQPLFEYTPHLKLLNIGFNQLETLEGSTIMAITNVKALEFLDLSHNRIQSIPTLLLRSLHNLKTLLLQGNQIQVLPGNFGAISTQLESFSCAANPIREIRNINFQGLKNLKELNISHMTDLVTIQSGSFSELPSLRRLFANQNPKLIDFDMEGLLHSTKLTTLDISNCHLGAFRTNLSTNKQWTDFNFASPWPDLQTLRINGNPWICDCSLMQIVYICNIRTHNNCELGRCSSPFGLVGRAIDSLGPKYVCDLPAEYIVPESQEKPKFLRRRYILVTILTIIIVLLIGLAVGFLIVCLKKKLERDHVEIAPIRYTMMRNSGRSVASETSNISY